MEEKKKRRWKRAIDIVVRVLIYIFLILSVFVLILSLTGKKDPDGTVNIFGKQMRIVQTSSMDKCDEFDTSGYEIKSIPAGAAVFIKTVPSDSQKAEKFYAGLKTGDVLTFKYVLYGEQKTITHRITEITQRENGGYTIKLQGDNRSDDSIVGTQVIEDTSDEASFNYVVGKVTGKSVFLGKFILALKSPVGIVCIIIIPCVVVIAFEVIRIITVVNESKREKQAKKQKSQDEEIEALRRQVEMLSQQSAKEKTEIENEEGE